MALVKTMPPMARIRHDIDRMFQRFLGEPWEGFETPLFEAPTFETMWTPSLDFSETDKEYMVKLEAPDVPKENLDVSLDGNVLTLSGRREARKEKESEKYIWREREVGRFVRTIRMPTAVEGEKIEASAHDGVLVVKLPKKEPTPKSKILIK